MSGEKSFIWSTWHDSLLNHIVYAKGSVVVDDDLESKYIWAYSFYTQIAMLAYWRNICSLCFASVVVKQQKVRKCPLLQPAAHIWTEGRETDRKQERARTHTPPPPHPLTINSLQKALTKWGNKTNKEVTWRTKRAFPKTKHTSYILPLFPPSRTPPQRCDKTMPIPWQFGGWDEEFR